MQKVNDDARHEPPARAVPRRRAKGLISYVPDWLISLASLLLAIGLWEFFGSNINPIFASYPSAIFAEGINMVASGEIFLAFLQSMQPLLVGYFLAAAIGIPLGLMIGRYRLAEAGLGIYVTAGYSTPLIALTPLFVLWFGLGFTVKVAIIFVLSIFPITINTWAGAKAVPRTLIEVGRTFVASELTIMRKIIVPATLPYIMVGLKLAVGRAVIAMIVAEFFTAVTGLGGIILKAGDRFDTARMFVPVLVLMALGIGLTWLVSWLEHKVAPWQRDLSGRDT